MEPSRDAAAPTPVQRLTTPAGSTAADLSSAPLPTPSTIRKRQSIPLQLSRFAVYNARIMRMVIKGHSPH
jgi:hypothetical protein